jgi:predicted permease
MDSQWIDLRHALCALKRSPAFTLVAVLTLTLGLGASTAIFMVVNGVLLEPLPYDDPDRLVEVEAIDLLAQESRSAFTELGFREYHEQNRVFVAMAAYCRAAFTLTGAGPAELLWGERVSAEYFQVMGVAVALGRAIGYGDCYPGAEKVVVLNHRVWQSRFGADPEILGRRVVLNGESHTVIGVMPPGFGLRQDLFVPLALDLAAGRTDAYYLFARARLREDVTLEEAQAEMRSLAVRLAASSPEHFQDRESIRVTRLLEMRVRNLRPALLIFHCAVSLLLLIACVNVANLLLARMARRQREMAVRTALGASRWQLLSQGLNESLLVTLAGGTLGLALAAWATRHLVALSGINLPASGDRSIDIDSRVLLFTIGLSLATWLLVGLLPALRRSPLRLTAALKGGHYCHHGDGVQAGRLRSTLVLVEVALALVLTVGAGLLIRSFAELLAVDIGFDPEGGVAAGIDLPPARYGEEAVQRMFYRQLVERVSSLPGVAEASTVFPLPLSGGEVRCQFATEGRRLESEPLEAHLRFVSPGYFETMGISLRSGRVLTTDDRDDAPAVVVVNRSAARHFWPGNEAVGQRLTFDNPATDEVLRWWTVVGVVGDVRHQALSVVTAPEIYISVEQWTVPRAALVVRVSSTAEAVLEQLRSELAVLDPDLPLTGARSFRDLVDSSLTRPRFNTLLLGLFGGLALLLAAVGVAGLISYSVARRRHEIGVRLALGATPGRILAHVFRLGLTPVGVGLVVGLGLALVFSRLLASLLFGVTSTDPVTFVLAPVTLTAVAIAACWIPARRATRVDPIEVLRGD